MYISWQLQKSTRYEGKSTEPLLLSKDNRLGIFSDGPIQKTVSPIYSNDDNNKSIVGYKGSIEADFTKAPLPGNFVYANIKGVINLFQKQQDSSGNISNYISSRENQLFFKIMAIRLHFPDTFYYCKGSLLEIYPDVYPIGGAYEFFLLDGVELVDKSDKSGFSFRITKNIEGTVSIRYKFGEVYVEKQLFIKPFNGSLSINYPDTLTLETGEIIPIKPLANIQGGTFSYISKGNVSVSSSSYSDVAYLKASNLPGLGNLEIKYKYCDAILKENIFVRVLPIKPPFHSSFKLIKGEAISLKPINALQGIEISHFDKISDNIQVSKIKGVKNQLTITGNQEGNYQLIVYFRKKLFIDSQIINIQVLNNPDFEVLGINPTNRFFVSQKVNISVNTLLESASIKVSNTSEISIDKALNDWQPIFNKKSFEVTINEEGNGVIIIEILQGKTVVKKIFEINCLPMPKFSLETNKQKRIFTHKEKVSFYLKTPDNEFQNIQDFTLEWYLAYLPIGVLNNDNWIYKKLDNNAQLDWEVKFAVDGMPKWSNNYSYQKAKIIVIIKQNEFSRLFESPFTIEAGKVTKMGNILCKELSSNCDKWKEDISKSTILPKGNPDDIVPIQLNLSYKINGSVMLKGDAKGLIQRNGYGSSLTACSGNTQNTNLQIKDEDVWKLNIRRNANTHKTIILKRMVQPCTKNWIHTKEVWFNTGLKILYEVGSGKGEYENSEIIKTVTPP